MRLGDNCISLWGHDPKVIGSNLTLLALSFLNRGTKAVIASEERFMATAKINEQYSNKQAGFSGA